MVANNMKSGRKRHWGRKIALTGGVLLICYLLAAVVPYLPHKKVAKERWQESLETATGAVERVYSVETNQEALLYRLRMIEEAEEEILLSTFDFNADEGGLDIMAALSQAAARGVRVRVLVDGMSGFLDTRGNIWFQTFASQENIELKIYNPFLLWKPWKLQARLHDKYLIIDDRMYLLGGRNTTNLFLGEYSTAQNIDRELLVYEGKEQESSYENMPRSSLLELRDYFERVWALKDSKDYTETGKPEKQQEARRMLAERYQELHIRYPEAFQETDWQALTMETEGMMLLTNPIEAENKEPWLWYSLCRLMEQGQRITIYTPYIICGKEMYEELDRLCATAAQGDIITNDVASGANPWGCTDYLNQKKRILKTGVRVHEFLGAHSNHTKTILIDDRISIVGSYNLDMRSTYLNTELMLVIDCEELNRQYRRQAEEDKGWCKSIAAGEEYQFGIHYQPREFSLFKKIFYAVLRLLIIPIRRLL